MIATLTALIALADLVQVRSNMATMYNGLGATASVLDRTADAPMRYRVLVPWLLAPIPRRLRAWVYVAIKAALIYGALLTASWHLEPSALLVLAVLILAAVQFDYWDNYAELFGLGLCLSGDPILVWCGGIVWGLSRETALLAPIVGLLTLGPIGALAGVTGPLALQFVRVQQGKAPLYCARWTWACYNLPDLRAAWRSCDGGVPLSLLWTAAALLALALPAPDAALNATRPLILAWLAAGWLMARARETRLFLPTALWIAGSLPWTC